jgi:phenylpropionate dioxygenase-like ring-hydroxylating dioxygenase large terminal subunit
VRAYPCREAYGLIFVFPGDPHKSGAAPFPEIPAWSAPGVRTMYFDRSVQCHYSFMHENLLDMNHQFLHRKLMGRIRPVLLELQTGKDSVEASYRFEQAGGKGSLAGDLLLGGVDPDPSSRDMDFITIRTVYPYQTLSMRRPNRQASPLELWVAYVPWDKTQRTTRSFGLLMIKKPRLPGLLYLAWPLMRLFAEKVFAQDRMAVEREQQAYDQQGGDWNQEVFPVILALRDLLIRQGVPIEYPSLVTHH